MTFWLTRWALSRGIVRDDDLEIRGVGAGNKYATSRDSSGIFLPIGRDAFDTEIAAQERVAAMVKRKLSALDKQRSKLLDLAASTEERVAELKKSEAA